MGTQSNESDSNKPKGDTGMVKGDNAGRDVAKSTINVTGQVGQIGDNTYHGPVVFLGTNTSSVSVAVAAITLVAVLIAALFVAQGLAKVTALPSGTIPVATTVVPTRSTPPSGGPAAAAQVSGSVGSTATGVQTTVTVARSFTSISPPASTETPSPRSTVTSSPTSTSSPTIVHRQTRTPTSTATNTKVPARVATFLSPTSTDMPVPTPTLIRASDVIPQIEGYESELQQLLVWWREYDSGNRSGLLYPMSLKSGESCYGLAWNTIEYGYHRMVVFQRPRQLSFADGGWYIKICAPITIRISPEDVGRIQADWLGKRNGIDNHPWVVVVD